MATPQIIVNDGVGVVTLNKWEEFDSIVKDVSLNFEYVFRGHKKLSYELLPGLYRKFPTISVEQIINHLEEFKKELLVDSE